MSTILLYNGPIYTLDPAMPRVQAIGIRDGRVIAAGSEGKVQAAVGAGLRVLLAMGETAEERAFGVGGETVLRQLRIGLHDVPPESLGKIQIAYEPVWSIGAGGTPASPEDVEPIARLIRSGCQDLFGDPGGEIPILYGGSVDPSNAGTFTALPDIDGLFVGRAAWTVEGFIATYQAGYAGKSVSRSVG